MKKSKFVKSILNLLEDMVLEYQEYHNSITMLVKDVNAEIEGKDLMEYLEKELETEGFKDISFSFGDGHWMTIHKSKR